MANYYNEFDPKAAAWLRELIRAGHIPAGDVDERSIVDVRASDLRGYTQCHFFAGIGGWAEALRLAEWPSDRPVWTGSCPCQPFSVAGKGLGTADERHLWPVFAELLRECRPAIAFGEQVASRAGRDWLAGVRADLEGMGYAVGAADLCAAGVGAPHIRQRLYWVANAKHAERRTQHKHRENEQHGNDCERQETHGVVGTCGQVCNGRLAVAPPVKPEVRERVHGELHGPRPHEDCSPRRLADMPSGGQRIDGGAQRDAGHADISGALGGLGDVYEPRPQVSQENGQRANQAAALKPSGAWSNFDILPCRDGKARRVESGSFPLAHGVPARVVRLRGYGNAIVPETAAAFIRASQEAIAADPAN